MSPLYTLVRQIIGLPHPTIDRQHAIDIAIRSAGLCSLASDHSSAHTVKCLSVSEQLRHWVVRIHPTCRPHQVLYINMYSGKIDRHLKPIR